MFVHDTYDVLKWVEGLVNAIILVSYVVLLIWFA